MKKKEKKAVSNVTLFEMKNIKPKAPKTANQPRPKNKDVKDITNF